MIEESEYPLWHGTRTMGPLLRDKISRDSFFVSGKGVRVTDHAGREYLDGRSSLWNLSLGYDHPKVLAAMHRQLDTLPAGTLLSYERAPRVTVEFAKALAARLPEGLRHIRLATTGSQAAEGAVLLSRFFRQEIGEHERTAVITFDGSFHGLGPAATLLSGYLSKAHDWCGPLLGDIHQVPSDGSWTDAVRARVEQLGAGRVTAVLLEPLMGSAGTIPEADDLRRLAEYCRGLGIHYIADEVTTGYGRVGHLSRTLQLGIRPDIMLFSKGITAGYVPGAAIVACDEVYAPLHDTPSGRAFLHGSTADGNPMTAAAGLAVLEVLYEDGVLDAVTEREKSLHAALDGARGAVLAQASVDGVGLMQRFTPRDAQGEPWSMEHIDGVHAAIEEAGLLCSISGGCLWFLPPLVITDQECAELGERLAAGVQNYVRGESGSRLDI